MTQTLLPTSKERVLRILVVTDAAEPRPNLKEAICRRAEDGDVRFRLLVLNPARAKVHLLHPERHDKTAEAEHVLLQALPALEACAGHPVIGSVSVRHDPMDAIEETLFSEPVDEIMLAVPAHGWATRLHQDLPHRLQHYHLPVTLVEPTPVA